MRRKLEMSFSGLVSILVLCLSLGFVAAQRSTPGRTRWQTLSGNAPVVVARGGNSGLFPDSSNIAYQSLSLISPPDVIALCNVQLTRDGAGICLPSISLQNGTNVNDIYGNDTTQGWLSIDFTLLQLGNVSLTQQVLSRSPGFDDHGLPILTVEDIGSYSASRLWLSVQHAAFYNQHNLSMRNYVISTSRRIPISYISSPEIGFLRSIASRMSRSTRLVFQFMGLEDVEPTTNQTYGSLLSNLTLITTFASGILVPKDYIWPVDYSSWYLQNHTSLVVDAHRAGLEVYASNFVNDNFSPHDYNYDPVNEYLAFIDNGIFSIDGVLSDFPITSFAAIDCYSHMGRNSPIHANVTIITNEGASGVYPGCTDLAYQQAVSDGADILDCPVQITSDGIPFCLGSINLRDRTNVVQSPFIVQVSDNPEIGIQGGVFTYNLTWRQIQTLRPAMYSPYAQGFQLLRNPRAQNQGNFMQLSEFLAFANNASFVSGVLLSVENAAYLARAQGLDVISAVLDTLNQSGYNNPTAKRVLVQSSDSAVLSWFRTRSNYELVYLVDENISGVLNSTILEIRNVANAVVVSKRSVIPVDNQFLENQTQVVQMLQAFNLSVYVRLFQNEFVSQAWDFYSDPYVEVNSYVITTITGIITDYPATASRYRRNRCLGYRDIPVYMSAIQPGSLINQLDPGVPPAPAPDPILTESDVVEPPLPPVNPRTPPPQGSPAPPPSSGPSLPRPTFAAVVITVFLMGCVL